MKRSLANVDGGFIECEVVRFFEKDGNIYLIYSLNEIDDSGYVKLYASKIIDGSARIISSDDEWVFVKEVIKDIVRSNRDGVLADIVDIDENKLDEIVLEDNRVFKLQGNLVNLLMDNKNVSAPLSRSSKEVEDYYVEPETTFENEYEDSFEPEISLENSKVVEESLENEPIENEWPYEVTEENQIEATEDADMNYEEMTYAEEPEYALENNESEYTTETDNLDEGELDYKALFEKVSVKNEILENQVEELQTELNTYKTKLDAITEIISNEL